MMYQFWSDGGHPYVLGAAFDGTNDYLLRGTDLTGNVDSKLGIFATRIRLNGGDGTNQRLYSNSTGSVLLQRTAVNTISLVAKTSVGTTILNAASTNTVTADGDDHNILIGYNMAGALLIYVDDADVTNSAIHIDDVIDYTVPEHAIGGSVFGSALSNADINFLYCNWSETLDFSVEANRRKFFDSQGNPVLSPSGNGSEATGSQPLIYLAGDYTQWESNLGTGGGFTVTGALERPSL